MGVAKAVEAAMATVIITGSGLIPVSWAVVMAMGATRTVVAVLEMNWLNTEVSTNRLAQSTSGLLSPIRLTRCSTTQLRAPLRSIASASGSMPAIRIRLVALNER